MTTNDVKATAAEDKNVHDHDNDFDDAVMGTNESVEEIVQVETTGDKAPAGEEDEQEPVAVNDPKVSGTNNEGNNDTDLMAIDFDDDIVAPEPSQPKPVVKKNTFMKVCVCVCVCVL